jgi:putative ABC transport system permease protein
MLKVTWRNLIARKIRLLMSAFSIVLGVAFVAGAMIFTDAMGGAFDDIIEGGTSEALVAHEGATDFDSMEDSRTIPAAVVRELEELPEAAGVHPQLQLLSVFVIGKDAKVIGGNGPPGLAFNFTQATALTGKPVMELVDGELPDAPFEVALDEKTAEKGDYAIGDEVRVVTPGSPPTITVLLTGLVDAGAASQVGATITVFDVTFMQQQFFGGRDVFSIVSLNAADGVSQEQLAEAARAVVGEGLQVRTGDQYVEDNEAILDEIMGFLQTFLLVFATVALVVGAFLIVNTFSILVAQRSRELALLRAMGASRRQVLGSVVLEALAVGVIGSTLGLGLGYLLAHGLRLLFGIFGLDLGSISFPVQPSTILAAYAVGIVVTAGASTLPAARAARIPPMAALRDDIALPESSQRRRVVVGSALLVIGVGSGILGFVNEGTTGLMMLGIGTLLVLVGVALMSWLLGHPLFVAFGVLYRRLFGAVGALASGNALRNPRRTAATSSALMVGLALMTMMSIFGASASASTDAAIDRTLTSQFIISNVIQQPFSTDVARQVSRIDGVAGVARLQIAFPQVEKFPFAAVGAMDPRQLTQAFSPPGGEAFLDALSPGKVVVASNAAAAAGVEVGDHVTIDFQGGAVDLEVTRLFPQGGLPMDLLVTPDAFAEGGLAPLDSMVFVTKEPGANTDEVRAAIETVLEPLPTVTVKDPEGYAAEQRSQVNQFLYAIYALLGFSVVIALLGVVNTLGLSVIERTREVGLLRAVGVSRRQLRTMIRLESVVVAVFGALLGLGIGLAFGSTLVMALEDQGLTHLAIPVPMLLVFLLLAAVLGVLAAILPARRAARLDVLRAIATE